MTPFFRIPEIDGVASGGRTTRDITAHCIDGVDDRGVTHRGRHACRLETFYHVAFSLRQRSNVKP